MFQVILVTVIFSAIVNILALASPLFMLEVYDRVLVSGSVPTLVALVTLALGMHMFSGFLDVVRGRMVNRIAALVDHGLSKKAILAIYKLSRNEIHDSQRSSQDLDQLRAFLNSGGPLALADLPWIPFYLLICFFLHPYIGWLATLSALTLIISTGLTDLLTRGKNAAFAQAIAYRNRVGENAHRNAEIISALRMDGAIEKRWLDVHGRVVALHQQLSDRISFSTAFSKTIRYAIQTCTLALGAWLVLGGEITAGTIVAASTVVARALAPIEQSIANWKGMVAAWQAWSRLRSVRIAPTVSRTTLPVPRHYLKVDSASVPAPGKERRLLLSNISFAAPSGNVIGIIGPSGSGKSTLLRSIVGTLPLASGRVELDGASLDQWDETLGVHIGYMPQHSELFEGSIAENICRLSEARDDGAIVAAAKAAGAHDMIVGFPNGYETRVIGGGDNLSGGQRQRIALARALYGDPFLIVLDEPNSNLDADGERALASAIKAVRARGGIVLLVAHRHGILEDVDYLLVLERGSAKAFGPRTGVLRAMRQEAASRRPQDGGSPLALEEQDA